MRPPFWLAMLLAATLGTGLTAQDQIFRDGRVLRTGIELTSITATVRDAEGHLVTGLQRDAFEIYEDGDPQPVAQFTGERVPISLGVLLDTSDSMFGQRIKD